MTANPSDEVRRYRVHEALGRGGFGTVYRAEMQASGGFTKPVALKVLNADVADVEDIVRRLRDEARMLGLLRHRSIVDVTSLVKLDGRWTVVMEYVEGVSLKQLVDAHGPIPPRVAIAVVQEVADALDTAYARPTRDGAALGLLHRDIKPANLQITPNGEVKLLDFGVARAQLGGREARTERAVYGSIPYMAPERFEQDDRHQSDIFALGSTLLEMLTGEPFGQTALHPRRFADQLEGALSRARARCTDENVIGLLRDLLAYEWEERPDARQTERRARDIAASLSGPWLKDWAETAVPEVLAHRQPETDTLSGRWLTEQSVAMEVGPGELPERPETTFDEPMDGASASSPPPSAPPGPPALSPVAPPAPPPPARSAAGPNAPARPRPPARSGVGRILWTIATILLFVCLLLLAGLAAASLLGVGVVTALCAPFWEQARTDSHRDDLHLLLADLDACAVSAPQEAMILLLEDALVDPKLGNVGLMEMVNLEERVDAATADGVIDQREFTEVRSLYAQFTRD